MRSQTATAEIGVKDTLIKKPRRHGIRFNKKYLMCLLIVSIPLIGFVAFSGFPVILSFISMFGDMKYNKLDTLTWNNFANFQRLFSDATLLQSVKVTLIIASAQPVKFVFAGPVDGWWDPVFVWGSSEIGTEENTYSFYCNNVDMDGVKRLVWQFGSYVNAEYTERVTIEISDIKICFKSDLDG